MFKKIVLAFIIWKVVLIFFALAASHLLPLQKTSTAEISAFGLPYLEWVWGNFDGVHYLEIARAGYQYPNYAFFPLYPLLISLGKMVLVTFRSLEIGLLISNASLFFSLFLLYKIARLDLDKRMAWQSVVLILAFPTALFYGAVYADSLYLLLSLVSFYSARKRQWLLAGVTGYLAGLTRLVGIVLLPALLLEWYIQKKFKVPRQRRVRLWRKISNFKFILRAFLKEKVFYVFLIPMALVSYGLYLQINFGDFLLFQKAMAQWNQSAFVFPLQVVFRYIKIFLTVQPSVVYFVAVVEFVATFSYFALSIYVMRKVRFSYGLFMLLILLIPTFTGTFQSMPRYLLHLFPAFIAVSLLTSGSKKIYWITIGVFLLLQFVFVSLFTRGFFIA